MLRNLVVLSLAMVMAGPVWAQTQTTPTRSASTRVAVINIQSAIAATEEGKQTAQKLQAQFAPRQTEIQNIAKQIQSIQQRLQDGQNTLSDTEKSRLQLQYQQVTRNYQRETQEYQQDTQDAQTDAMDSIGQKMMPIISKYANDNNYNVVLDTSTQSSPILFASSTIDITNAIIKLYDQQYPVKSATAPAAGAK